jgi:hypothetical protein
MARFAQPCRILLQAVLCELCELTELPGFWAALSELELDCKLR